MKAITNNFNNEIIINKSRFITYLYKVENDLDVGVKIKEIKNMHKNATHYCYAYIIGNTKRFNDDKEPSGTAGIPMLNVLEKNELDNILCIVVRYFGGIKLGSGGLIRAYSNSVSECLKLTSVEEIFPKVKVRIQFQIKNITSVDNVLKNTKVINKNFNNTVTYDIIINEDNYSEMKTKLKQLVSNFEIIQKDS